jgi:hypothetical protein
VSSVCLLEERLYLNVSHAGSRAIEAKRNSIVRRCILVIFYCVVPLILSNVGGTG